jgi:transposase
MNGEIYSAEVLPYHIKHLQWLQAKQKHIYWFQEDNDPSHGTKNPMSLPARLKIDSDLKCLTHPPQSPDLNPIEAIWQIIKERLKGGKWKTAEEFKEAIQSEWRQVTQREIRRRIREMPSRCQQVYNTKGEPIRSNLWLIIGIMSI